LCPDGEVAALVEKFTEKRQQGDREEEVTLYWWKIEWDGRDEAGTCPTMQEAKGEADREMQAQGFLVSGADGSKGTDPKNTSIRTSLGNVGSWGAEDAEGWIWSRYFGQDKVAEVWLRDDLWHWSAAGASGVMTNEAEAKVQADTTLWRQGWTL